MGPGVKGLNEGSWVVPLRSHMGTWQDLAIMKAADLVVIPQDCMPPECAALSQQLCLAYCLLEQFGKLKVIEKLPNVQHQHGDSLDAESATSFPDNFPGFLIGL